MVDCGNLKAIKEHIYSSINIRLSTINNYLPIKGLMLESPGRSLLQKSAGAIRWTFRMCSVLPISPITIMTLT